MKIKPMEDKPIKPKDSDCCGSGCKPCIFDVYEENLKKWKSGRLNKKNKSNALKQDKYSPFLIIDSKYVTDTLKFIQFKGVHLKKNSSDDVRLENTVVDVDYDLLEGKLNIQSGEYLILKGSNEENHFISRSYTPVLNEPENDRCIFAIYVSLIKNGNMSEFIRKVNVNDILFWRGPYTEFKYVRNSYDHLICFAGGTGIVPLYNITKSIVLDDDENTRIKFLCSFKSVKHVILKNELFTLNHYWNFNLKIFISRGDDDGCDDDKKNKSTYNEIIKHKKIDESIVSNEINDYEDENVLVLISGPQSFNESIKNHVLNIGINETNIFILS